MTDRIDENGAAYAGSQLQTQLYVNRRTRQLDDAIRAEFTDLTDATFVWRSPLAADGYAEYSDRAILEQVGLGHHAADLRAFWPTGGPHWDALATVQLPGSDRPRRGALRGQELHGRAVHQAGVPGEAELDIASAHREVARQRPRSLLFLDDPHDRTNAGEWETALKKADDELGLTGLAVPAAGHVLLPAGTRDELIA